MTDVEVYQPQTLAPVGAQELDTMIRQADLLAQSDIIPKDYRRKPANILVAAMTGRTFGWDVMTAMRNGHVIEGSFTIKPEAMLALIRRAGHSVSGDTSPTTATVHGKRCDTGDEMSVTFTLDDAVRAGLCTIRDGKPYARSSTGKPLPWEQYPQSMCWARAVSALARMLFADVTLGLSYTPEELGATVDADGAVVDAIEATSHEGPFTISPANAERLRELCAEKDLDVARVVVLGTDGRTSDPDQLYTHEIAAVKDAVEAMAELATEEPDEAENASPDAEPSGGYAGHTDPAEARAAWDADHPETEF